MSLVVTSIPLALLALPLLPIFAALNNNSKNDLDAILYGSNGLSMSRNSLQQFMQSTFKVDCLTDITSSEELVQILENANYTITMDKPKEFTTYIPNSYAYVRWFEADNSWIAEFRTTEKQSNNYIKEISEEYMAIINKAASRDVFGISSKEGALPKYTYETAFQDQDVLLKTIDEHGAQNIIIKDKNVSCTIEKVKFEFTKEEGRPYMALASYDGNKQDLIDTMSNLNNEYCENVQEKTYETIKKRVEEQNLQIENEEVLEDNSILLTINLD